eukprot:SAG22_NODE_9924_length_563_cov_1.068966_1_plen_71_part_10
MHAFGDVSGIGMTSHGSPNVRSGAEISDILDYGQTKVDDDVAGGDDDELLGMFTESPAAAKASSDWQPGGG